MKSAFTISLEPEPPYSPPKTAPPFDTLKSKGSRRKSRSYSRSDSLMDFNVSFKNFFDGANSLLNNLNLKKKLNSKDSKNNSDRMSKSEVETNVTATAIIDFNATEEDMITFKKSDKITNVETITGGWWRGQCHEHVGRFPSNCVILDFIRY